MCKEIASSSCSQFPRFIVARISWRSFSCRPKYSLIYSYTSFCLLDGVINLTRYGLKTVHLASETNENLVKKIALDRFGTPDEVADAAAFLAKNEYANNCILNLDGGLSAT